MKGVTYDLTFKKQDNSIISMSGLTVSDLITTLPYLFKQHYSYELNCNRYMINSLHSRVNKVNKFVRDKATIKRIEKKNTNPDPSKNSQNSTNSEPDNNNLAVEIVN
jgi:hypothetical protein